MTLPPEHINIKRRREEEPVETLYIQSELHQKKRRFTDFIFQRVDANAEDASPSTTAIVDVNQQRRDVQSPRAVSGFAGTSSSSSTVPGQAQAWPPRGGIGIGGAPRVRVTSPGAERREGRGRGSAGGASGSGAGAGGLRTSSSRTSLRSRSRGPSPLRKKESASQLMTTGSSNLRRFHLSKPVTAASSGAGVQKKRAGGGDVGRAILVEKLARGPEKGSVLSDAASVKNGGLGDVSMLDDGGVQGISSAPARKRPVINSAEKRWREEQRAASSRAKADLMKEDEKGKGKTGKSVRDDPSNWDRDSDQLAQELEEVALEMLREETKPSTPKKETDTPGYTPMVGVPKPELKYQPRNPTRRVHDAARKREDPDAMETDAPTTGHTAGKHVTGGEEYSDDDYVYDTYVRRPLPVQEPSSDRYAAAAAAESAETILRAAKMPMPTDGDQLSRNIGVVVISAEDEEYWDTYAVEDDSRGEEKEWDSEDEDSNAEDHPSNDYPDEELASDDEDDDPTAIYRNYRHRAASDDEQDFSDFGDEDDFGYHADDVDSDGEIGGGRGMGMGWGFR